MMQLGTYALMAGAYMTLMALAGKKKDPKEDV